VFLLRLFPSDWIHGFYSSIGAEIKDSGGEAFWVDFLIIEEDGIRYSD
jgi:hypothetical protein